MRMRTSAPKPISVKEDTRLIYDPLPFQREFMEATEPEVLLSGAIGPGKTLTILQKLKFLAQYYPGNRVLLLRKVARDLPATTLVTLHRKVLHPDHVIAHHKTEHRITIKAEGGTSEIWYGGMDRQEAWGGSEFGAIGVDEATELSEDDWDYLAGRLRHPVPFRQIFGATNPNAPSHWMYNRFFENEHEEEDGKRLRRTITCTAFDNPYHPPDYYDRLRRYRGVFYDRYVLGKWIGFEGLVYGDFNPRLHIVPSFDVPAEWRRLRGVDFGGGNPHSVSWYAEEPSTGTWFQYKQIYRTGIGHRELAALVAKGDDVEATIADHDAAGRIEFEEQGISITAAKKAGKDAKEMTVMQRGIQIVGQFLEPREAITEVPTPNGPLEFPSGAPRILFMEDALDEPDPRLVAERLPLCTTDEMGAYKWQRGVGGVIKDVPVKKDDHGLDELRYVLYYVTGGQFPMDTVDLSPPPPEVKAKVSTKADRIAARKARRNS